MGQSQTLGLCMLQALSFEISLLDNLDEEKPKNEMATLLEVPKGMSAGPCLYGCGDETSAFSFHCSLPLLLLHGLIYQILWEHIRA